MQVISVRGRRILAAQALLGLVVLGLSLLWPATSAQADEPFRLPEQITDRVGALGDRRDEAEAALARLYDETRLQLFVVFVDSFDGLPAQQWADETAVRSDLGDRDALLAVAIGDRDYAYSVDQDFPLSDAQLADVAAGGIEPRLAAGDWAGAVIAAADGYREQVQQRAGGGRAGVGVGLLLSLICVLFVAAIVVVGLLVWRRSRRRPAPAAVDPDDPHPGVPTQKLNDRANTLLVEMDDAVRTSERELALAREHYGQEATKTFDEAVTAARNEVAEAFRLRMLLDEEPAASDEKQQRRLLADILRHCEAADRRLDAEADAFEALRQIEANLEEILPRLRARSSELQARLPAAEAGLARLRDRYTGPTLAAVQGNPEQARERVAFAANALEQAGAALSSGRRPRAALAVRGAEQALDQAVTLLDGIERAGADLDAARDGLAGLVAEVETDLAAARGAHESAATPGEVKAALAAAIGAAEQTLAAARAALAAATMDPLEIDRRLQEADAALDEALADVRDASERAARARARLDQAIRAAQAEISAATDYIGTRRGAVREQARTLLADAQRRLSSALAAAESDPVSALADAQQAEHLAELAIRAAQSDVGAWQAPGGFAGTGADAALGGLAGAILGGILVGGPRRRPYGGGWGGGFGGGWGGPRRGGFGGHRPGGFGGAGRRGGGGGFGGGGRRGGGGRF